MTRFLVREIRYGADCWPRQSVTDADLDLVCPLCVLAGRPATKTAVLQHFVRCEQCNRLSAIYAPDGLMSLFPISGPSLLVRLAEPLALVRSALRGEDPRLRDIIELDETRPVIVLSNHIHKIHLPRPGGAEPKPGESSREASSVMPLGGVPHSILRLLAQGASCKPGDEARLHALNNSPTNR